MKSHWRKILSMLPSKIERNFYSNFFKKEHELWEKNGKKLPVFDLIRFDLARDQGILIENWQKCEIFRFVASSAALES